MIVSNRQRRLLEVLLKRQEEVTAGELAEELQISARTVHREIQELEPLLEASGLSLVRKSGIGMSLQGSDADIDRFREQLGASVSDTFSPEERKALILCQLLEEVEPVKLFTLAHSLHAAVPTVTRDLDELEPRLRRPGLELVRRRGYGVEIAGEEAAKRDLIASLAQMYLDESDLFGSSSDTFVPGLVVQKLLRMVGKEQFHAIEHQLWKLEAKWPRRLSETAYTRLLIRLSVAITRMRGNHWIDSEGSSNAADGSSEVEAAAAGESTEPKRSSSPELDCLLEAFGPNWPEAEKAYVQRLLNEAAEEAEAAADPAAMLERYGLAIAEAALALIRSVGKRLNVPFDKDRSLLDGLVKHLGPALERLRAGETIRNPLLQQIKKDYAPLFAAVREGADETIREIDVPDEEIGYLVMHFGASIERWKMFPRSVRALLVCTSGIGSSKLLAVRINKEFPQIELLGHYSWYEAARIPQDRYDLIVSTVDLPVEPDRYIKLSPLLTQEEAEKLRGFIRQVAAGPLPEPSAASSNAPEGPLERLKRLNAYTSEIVQLLDQFEVHSINAGTKSRDLRAVLRAILGKVTPTGNVREPELIVQQLIERENSGTQLIADTGTALFHTRSEGVTKPVLSLFRLASPLPLGAGAEAARQILLMLAPRDLSRPGLEVLSEISAMLLLPELIRLLEEADAEEIKAFVSQELEDFMRQKENGESVHEHFVQRESEIER